MIVTETKKLLEISAWLGLNQSPDGDGGLKPGEASVMVNWRVTPDGHLRLRPGTETVLTLAAGPVRGLWYGAVGGLKVLLAAAGGHIWSIDAGAGTKTDVGALTDAATHFFGFGGRVWCLNGHEYKCWSGSGSFTEVEGYAPLVAEAAPPSGGGTRAQQINRLTGKRRMTFSPDGSARAFRLPETGLASVDGVKLNGAALTAYTADLAAGTVTLATAPAAGTATLEVGWTKGAGDRASVLGMRFSEVYNGAADTRVFIYGDGTNRALYTGLNSAGEPDASYFPELNFVDVDSANTPLTSLLRHFDRLLAFKTDGLWSMDYTTLTLADGSVTPGFITSAVNREIGSCAPGQARLVDNWPRTLFGQGLYKWTTTSVRDERSAARISSRVEASLAALELASAVTFDHERRRELYIFCGNTAIVHNYGRDVFYVYTGVAVSCAEDVDGQLFAGTADGRLVKVSDSLTSDSGTDIEAVWESGTMDFGAGWVKKHVPRLLLELKPESGGRVTVSARTNRNSALPERLVSVGLATFLHASFAHFAFGTSRMPQTRRIRLRLSRFTGAKLRLTSVSSSAAPTVLSAGFEYVRGGRAG